jgi:hypothetical protein
MTPRTVREVARAIHIALHWCPRRADRPCSCPVEEMHDSVIAARAAIRAYERERKKKC